MHWHRNAGFARLWKNKRDKALVFWWTCGVKAHFVTFLSPGTFFSEETTKPITRWDSKEAAKMARSITERYNAKPFAFYFTTRSRKEKELDSRVTRTSGRYYLGGKLMSLKDVEREMPNEKILQGNMRANGWSKVIVNTNSWRICQPFEKHDVLLDWKP